MKNLKYIFVFAALLGLASCSSSFLDKYPQGSTLLEEQYNKLENAVEGAIIGIYQELYKYEGDHDAFSMRAFDMYGDLNCGDMAMSKQQYGWFNAYDEGYMYAYAGGAIWSKYYGMIRLCNNSINAVEAQGRPVLPETQEEMDLIPAAQQRMAFYYGEVLALRGWCYSKLMNYYCKPTSLIAGGLAAEETIPYYSEVEAADPNNMGEARSSALDVYTHINEDLRNAILYMDKYEHIGRASKLEVNADVARAMLAYNYLNMEGQENCEKALKYAKEVIDAGHFRILPNDLLLSTGFANVNEASWMWGQDVTVETYTALPSFQGQCDIYTYSYAYAGDVKGIDANLLESVTNMGWDGRVDWWLPAGHEFEYAPAGKFYSPEGKATWERTGEYGTDHNWLNDNVFMRIESVYLIAAEAALFQTTPDLALALEYLDAIMSQRLRKSDPDAASKYAAYKATLTNIDELTKCLAYNWRVEMWGEGYGMQTMRRLTHTNTLGDNHLPTRNSQTINYDYGRTFTFMIPTSETRYNQSIGTELEY